MDLRGARLHVGVSNPRADLPDVLAFLAAGRFAPARIGTRVAAWEDAAEAFLDRDVPKVVVNRRLEPQPAAVGAPTPTGMAPPLDRSSEMGRFH